MTQQFGFLFSNSVEFHTFYCFIFIYCVAALVMTLNVYFSPCLQKDCKTFLTRIKTSDSPVLYKGAQLWFFFSFMLPTRVFIMSSIIQSLSFPFIVGATILSGLPVIRTVLLAWFFILSENMSVGFFYHNSSRFKRVFDLFCGGSDMVLLFLGNTGSTALREFIQAVKAVGVGSGASESSLKTLLLMCIVLVTPIFKKYIIQIWILTKLGKGLRLVSTILYHCETL